MVPDESTERFESAPAQSFRWLRPFLPKRLQPWLRGVRKRWKLRGMQLEEPFRSVFTHTQVSQTRQRNLVRLATQIDEGVIEGDVVECGVLDGGTAALMAASTAATRRVHLFDAWQGLPESSEEDGEAGRKWVGEVVGSPKRVVEVLRRVGVDLDRVVFHRGWFHETFPTARTEIDRIALLHIDCDFYEPTRLCLETWYPLISPGGYLQIDDYASFQGCRRAVDEFLAVHPELRLERTGGVGPAYFLQKPAGAARE